MMEKTITYLRNRLVEASTHAGLAAIWGTLAAQVSGGLSKFSLIAGSIHAAFSVLLKGGDGGEK